MKPVASVEKGTEGSIAPTALAVLTGFTVLAVGLDWLIQFVI